MEPGHGPRPLRSAREPPLQVPDNPGRETAFGGSQQEAQHRRRVGPRLQILEHETGPIPTSGQDPAAYSTVRAPDCWGTEKKT